MAKKKKDILKKRTINFVKNETNEKNKKTIIIFMLVFIPVFFAIWFIVSSQMTRIQRAEAEYRKMETQLNEYKKMNTEYDEVKNEYDTVTDWYMTDEEKLIPDKNNIFKMLEDDVMGDIGIESVQINGNVITVRTSATTLHILSRCLDMLKSDNRIEYVTVDMATPDNSDERNNVFATIIIHYKGGSKRPGEEN